MTREPGVSRLPQCVAGMIAIENRIEALLDRLRGEVRGHAGTASAFERFHAIARDHRDGLVMLLRELRDLPGRTSHSGHSGRTDSPGPDEAEPPAAAVGTGGEVDGMGTGAVTCALRDVYLAFNEATVGYSVLHETAHVFDSVRHSATLRMAEQHLRSYTRAAQEINQLIADVVAWELRQEGQFCECQCPSCALGICWCIAHTTDTISAAWRETAPAYPSGGLRVAPNPRRPAQLDVREGDLVIAVNGRRAATTADVTTAVLALGPGQSITFGIERRSIGAIEVTATRT